VCVCVHVCVCVCMCVCVCVCAYMSVHDAAPRTYNSVCARAREWFVHACLGFCMLVVHF